MALIVTIKADFGTLQAKIGSVQSNLISGIDAVLNHHGDLMTDAALLLITANTGVPNNEVNAALDRYRATGLSQRYEVRSNQDKFSYARWITARDEKVCPICKPRDGVIYSYAELRYIFPAHPNCRCKIEPVDIGSELVAVAPDVIDDATTRSVQDILALFTKVWNA